MKTWKLVAGILDIVLFVIVIMQSCAAGMVNSIEQSGDVGGSAGLLVAILLLSGGIVSVATRSNKGKGGNIALIILFVLAALLGFSNANVYKDLSVWAAWCLINAVMAVVALLKNKDKKQGIK